MFFLSNFWGAYQLTEISTCTHLSIYVYLRKCLPRTYFGEYVVLISCCCYRRAPTGWLCRSVVPTALIMRLNFDAVAPIEMIA